MFVYLLFVCSNKCVFVFYDVCIVVGCASVSCPCVCDVCVCDCVWFSFWVSIMCLLMCMSLYCVV